MHIFEFNDGPAPAEPTEGRIKLKRYLAQTQNKNRPAPGGAYGRATFDSSVSRMDITPNFNHNGRRKEDPNRGRTNWAAGSQLTD